MVRIKQWSMMAAGAVCMTIGSTIAASSAQAANIFENGFPTGGGGISDYCKVGICDPNIGIFGEVGNSFTLSSASVIQGALWAGGYAFGDDSLAADDFSIRIFDVSNGIPNATPRLEYNNVQVSRNDFGFGFPPGSLYNYRYSLDTPITLAAGTYFLSIVNNTPTDPDDWFWGYSGRAGAFFRDRPQQPDGSFAVVNWERIPPEYPQGFAFALGGEAVPVPTPALLPGLVGLGLAAVRKRRAAGASTEDAKG